MGDKDGGEVDNLPRADRTIVIMKKEAKKVGGETREFSIATEFVGKERRLEKNVYHSLKGRIRKAIIDEDIHSHCPQFDHGGLKILDIGGGSGRFALSCARRNHQITLIDESEEMVAQAHKRISAAGQSDFLDIAQGNFLGNEIGFKDKYDLVAMHGSAEWMEDAKGAILKACSLVKPGGILSLLVFNADRLLLKRGINGDLLHDRRAPGGLTPPNGMAPGEVESLLRKTRGEIKQMSGVRVFYGFFRFAVDLKALTDEEWIEQERMFARREPFSRLGEHTHVVWRSF